MKSAISAQENAAKNGVLYDDPEDNVSSIHKGKKHIESKAARIGRTAREHATAMGFKPNTGDWRSKVGEYITILTDGGFLPELPIPPAMPVIENIMETNRHGYIVGASNAGKSFLALDMLAHISLGKRWMGFRVRGSHAIYFDAEGSDVDLRVRGIELNLNGGKHIPRLHARTRIPDITNHTTRAALVDELKELCGGEPIGAICFDTYAATMAACTRGDGSALEENNTGDAQRMADALKDLAVALNCAAFFVHHPGKDASKGARGASSLHAAVAFAYTLTIPNPERPRELNFSSAKKRGSGMMPGEVFGVRTRIQQLYTAEEVQAHYAELEDWFGPQEEPQQDMHQIRCNDATATLVFERVPLPPFEDAEPEKAAEKRGRPNKAVSATGDWLATQDGRRTLVDVIRAVQSNGISQTAAYRLKSILLDEEPIWCGGSYSPFRRIGEGDAAEFVSCNIEPIRQYVDEVNHNWTKDNRPESGGFFGNDNGDHIPY